MTVESGARGVTLGPGGEFDLLRRMIGSHRHSEIVGLGPGDDCAMIEGRLAITTDQSVEGVHFERSWLEFSECGYRAGAAALSDLAAVAAKPVAVLVSMALPAADLADGAAEELQRGIAEVADSVGATIIGGDLSRAPQAIVISVTALGEVDTPVLRSGVQPGDEIWVTGRLGGAAFAVSRWLKGEGVPGGLRRVFARPQPRVPEARWLDERGVLGGMIDLSDGLSSDAHHLAAASSCALVIDEALVPVDRWAQDAGDDALSLAFNGGEDYELLFAARAGQIEPLLTAFRSTFETELTLIGRAEAGAGVWKALADGVREPLIPGGFDHTRGVCR